MSDDWIVLIPEDPRFIPEAARQSRARERFAEIAPLATEIEITVSDEVRFFDCGTNHERIGCPSCGSEISMDWWESRMNDDRDGGFRLAPYATPCCGQPFALNSLVYEWNQGFGRFSLEAMNPNTGKLENDHILQLEEILGTKLRVIYQHV